MMGSVTERKSARDKETERMEVKKIKSQAEKKKEKENEVFVYFDKWSKLKMRS